MCCYTPNSKDQLARLDYRMAWEDDIRDYLLELDGKKPVVYCGDLNVAHTEKDIKNPGPNRRNPGFTDEEREKMTRLLSSGFTDTFRYLYPTGPGPTLVELPLQRPEEQRRVADRLLYRLRPAEGQNQKRRHLERGAGQRPLPGSAGAGCVNDHEHPRPQGAGGRFGNGYFR